MHHTFSRRSFTRLLPALPLAATGMAASAASHPSSVPQRTFSRRLTAEEEELAGRYLARHETFMAPLRALTLPNSLPPYFVTRAVPMRNGEEKPDG